MSRKFYEKELARLQAELVKVQEWVKATNLPEIRRPFASPKTRFYFNLLPNGFLGIWSFILLAVLTSGLWRTPQGLVRVDIPRGNQASVDDRVRPGGADEPTGQGRKEEGAASGSVVVGSHEERRGDLDAEDGGAGNQVIAKENVDAPKRSAREIRAEKVTMSGSKEKERESRLRIAPDSIPF